MRKAKKQAWDSTYELDLLKLCFRNINKSLFYLESVLISLPRLTFMGSAQLKLNIIIKRHEVSTWILRALVDLRLSQISWYILIRTCSLTCNQNLIDKKLFDKKLKRILCNEIWQVLITQYTHC